MDFGSVGFHQSSVRLDCSPRSQIWMWSPSRVQISSKAMTSRLRSDRWVSLMSRRDL
ncbi:hypothetical protein AALP_AA8G264000 [Arabis alpina]|uniref:Uncharacterized protein n=1 Tax=Arabis alpina TaxID=50452 RepID=A0A087G9K4_ARAAL|nr:hypothetical protein AALP_AA8G264000 [Arabis alpina]